MMREGGDSMSMRLSTQSIIEIADSDSDYY